jgi:CHAT domain-containing protein
MSMAPANAAAITFVVSGIAQSPERAAATRGLAPPPLPAGLTRGTVKQSVRVAARRGGGSDVRLSAQPGEDVVVLQLVGGPALVLHPENARDLLLAQAGATRARGAERAATGEIEIPASLRWAGFDATLPQRGGERGTAGAVLLGAVEIVTGIGKDKAADFIAAEVVRNVDAQVNPGVYALAPDALRKLKDTAAPLPRLPGAPAGEPLLVFVHGTFSDTRSAFDKLWLHHPQHVATLFERYGNRVYALDHPTLGVSPIENALMLANACPKGARLHLVTHSRGGLVAEVLARVCAKPRIGAADLAFFRGEPFRPQRTALQALARSVAERGLRVERIVRVGCPARGTLLASKRLDAYLSVFKWSLELAKVPIAPEIVDLLAEVARRRADPEVLPGLAAQIPDSPLIRWLHAANDALPGDLRIVAGDIEGDSVIAWLKTLLADAFFWTDHDLIVQTRSMYGGAPRAGGATFVFDRGGAVSHFNYFFNPRTAEAVVDALVQSAPPGFRTVGPLSWAGKSPTGERAALRGGERAPQPDKPAVFVLPGILGSNLRVGNKRIWLSWRLVNGLKRLAYTPDQPDGVEPDGAIEATYEDFERFLGRTHEVVEFAYDWRKPLEDEAQRLARAIDAALAVRAQSGQPVRIVAHSMGGLLARTMLLERPQTWQRMMARDGARLLMLGTPNGGSWAPMQVLSGDDTFGNALVAVGAPFEDRAARQMMAGLPGFIQLQAALTDPAQQLDRSARWQELADRDLAQVRAFNAWHHNEIQLHVYEWGVPPQPVLDRAVALRQRLDAQRDGSLVPFRDRMLLVAGRARFTPDGYDIGEAGLEYLNAAETGDGRVTLTSARIPGVRTWQIDCEHGKLPAQQSAFPAYLELLERGSTNLLAPLPDVAPSRGAAAGAPDTRVRSRPSRDRPPGRPPEFARDVFGSRAESTDAGPAAGTMLKVSVINGDLMFVRQPLLLGHYTSLRLTGTERVVDRLLGGAMSVSLGAGLYPDGPGTHQVFLNARRDKPLQMPRPEAAIVVGLGAESTLRAVDLVRSVRQAVVAWARRLTETAGGAPAAFEVASTLIGSGGVGITVGQAGRLIAQGVREANQSLAESRLPVVAHLHLVELYLDRAGDVWRALQVQAAAAPGEYDVAEPVRPGIGGLARMLDSGYRGADYDFISALTKVGEGGEQEIAYTLDTRRARSEVRAQQTQSRLLRNLVSRASSATNADPEIGRTLFKLLVPLEMEPFLGGTTDMQIEVDAGTAGLPWELLDSGTPGGGDARPWAIRAKLLRKLRTADFRPQPADANADASVLIIGEPACDPARYARLPGARAEANAVAQALGAAKALRAGRVTALVSPDDSDALGADAQAVVSTLLGRDWRVVHIAGHGEAPSADGDPRGVALSDDTYLGPREIRTMRVVPELVFVNCCHLAARDTAQLLSDRPGFAAGVAQALIEIGVRCVIAAGWAVDDDAAGEFATRFYQALLRGQRFLDAVAEARQAAWELGGNTWAAYQCYGDPDWRFVAEAPDAQRPSASLADEFAGIAASKTLVLALEILAVRSKYQKAPPDEQKAKLRHLESRFAALWGGIGEVAEGFGNAWAEAGDRAAAVRWYAQALDAADGTASLRVVEQCGNLRARNAWEAAERAFRDAAVAAKAPAAKRRGAARTAAQREHAKAAAAREAVLRDAREEIGAAVHLLERATDLQPTVERESLCGSAWKRLAMIEAAAGNPEDETAAVRNMRVRYERALGLARTTGYGALFYPALNWMASELTANAGKRGRHRFDPDLLSEIRANLAAKTRDDPDFWSVVSITELRMYEAMAEGSLAGELNAIVDDYEDLYSRVTAPSLWTSVLDQLRFVLPKYAASASAAECEAVTTIARLLMKFAGMYPQRA